MDSKFLKETYDAMLQGTYDPIALDKAYKMLTGNQMPTHIRMKKQTLYYWANNVYVESVDEPVQEETVIDTHIVTEKPEEVKMEKPETKKKKRVYKRKTKGQDLKIEHDE